MGVGRGTRGREGLPGPSPGPWAPAWAVLGTLRPQSAPAAVSRTLASLLPQRVPPCFRLACIPVHLDATCSCSPSGFSDCRLRPRLPSWHPRTGLWLCLQLQALRLENHCPPNLPLSPTLVYMPVGPGQGKHPMRSPVREVSLTFSCPVSMGQKQGPRARRVWEARGPRAGRA